MKVSEIDIPKEEVISPKTSFTDYMNYIKMKGYFVDQDNPDSINHWIKEYGEFIKSFV